jgi:hypothetical protein
MKPKEPSQQQKNPQNQLFFKRTTKVEKSQK